MQIAVKEILASCEQDNKLSLWSCGAWLHDVWHILPPF